MDTTAAAELGMGDANGAAAFWHAGPPVPDHWGDPGDNADLLDDADDHVAWDPAIPPSTALPPDFPASPSGRFVRATEPPAHHLRSMPDATLSHSHAVPPHPSFSGGATGHGAGPPSGRANSSAAASPHFFTGGGGGGTGAVGSSPSGVGAVGRGRGMGSIFYKTKLCSRFRSGNCPYNTNCNFAHGMEELRKPPPGWEEFVASQELPPPNQSGQAGSGAAGGSTDSQVRFHKTRPCKKYFGEGNCPYGEKCNFLHDEQSVPRAVREAREAAVAANSGSVVATPKIDTTTLVPATNGHLKETGGSTTSAEVQRYGGLSDANAPAVSDSKSGGTTSARDSMVSWHQRHAVGGASSAARSGFKRNSSSTWRGPHDISTIYGDWWVEDDDWPCEGGIHQS